MGLTVLQIADRVRDEADAYKFLEELRWGAAEPTCPHCDHQGATYIEPANGKSRATRTGAQSQRRVWRCRSCRRQFSVLTGTVMHGTKVSIRIWILVIFEMCSSKNGVAAREIERKYGVCPRTAWHLMHRIREAMKRDALVPMFRGVVVADETFFGGKEKNKHISHRRANMTPADGIPTPHVPGTKGISGTKGKTAVLTLIDASRGESRSVVVPDVTAATLRKAIAEQVDLPNTVLHTDEAQAYKPLRIDLAGHETVNHSQDEYVRYEDGEVITSNQAESFFSQLKRSIDGTHHHVSREHLNRYLAEFDYRYSTREISDTDRMKRLIGQVGGKRLTYKRVAA